VALPTDSSNRYAETSRQGACQRACVRRQRAAWAVVRNWVELKIEAGTDALAGIRT